MFLSVLAILLCLMQYNVCLRHVRSKDVVCLFCLLMAFVWVGQHRVAWRAGSALLWASLLAVSIQYYCSAWTCFLCVVPFLILFLQIGQRFIGYRDPFEPEEKAKRRFIVDEAYRAGILYNGIRLILVGLPAIFGKK